MTSALTPANPHPPALRYGAVQVYSRVEAKRRRKERGNRSPRFKQCIVPGCCAFYFE